jgi:hypothetical protein
MHVQGLALSFRIATFNLENLDEHGLAARVAALRPILVRLRAPDRIETGGSDFDEPG